MFALNNTHYYYIKRYNRPVGNEIMLEFYLLRSTVEHPNHDT